MIILDWESTQVNETIPHIKALVFQDMDCMVPVTEQELLCTNNITTVSS